MSTDEQRRKWRERRRLLRERRAAAEGRVLGPRGRPPGFHETEEQKAAKSRRMLGNQNAVFRGKRRKSRVKKETPDE